MEVIGRETRFEPTPLLRGFFFTSGTQAGRPIDRLLSSIAARFGVAEAASGGGGPKGRSYFLQNLLEKVIFAEAAIAGRDPKAERRRRTLRLGVIAGSAAACALLTVAWLFGWAANTRLIHVLEQRTAKLQADVQTISQGDVSDSDLGAILPVLNEARSLPFASTASKAERSAGFSFGVGQAGALRPQVDGAYHNLLNRQLLPRLILVVEDRLRALTTGSEAQAKDAQSRTYNLLRVYLMLGRAPGAPLQKAQIQGWFEDAWAERYPGEEDTPTREALSGHLSALLSGPLSPPSLDRDLVATARQQVAGLSPGERVYSRLVDDPELRALAPYDISSVAEVSSSGLFTMKSGRSMALGVPGMFRRGSFYGPVMTAIGKAAAEASDETWVTGEDSHGSSVAQAGRVKDGILIAYLADFTRHWDDYIGDIGISAKYPMDERIHRAVRPPSPVKALFASLATETNLIPPSLAPGKGGSGVAALRTAALFSHTIYSGVARADQVAAANAAASGPSQKGPLDEVIDHYGWLRDMQPPRGPSPLDDALEALKDTGDSTQAAKAATGVGDALLQKDKTSAAMASAAKLKSASAGLPPAAGSLFTGFVSASTSALNASAKGALNQAWTTGVLPECKSVLVQGFPFSPSDHQVSLDDFGRLFRPGGLIDAFRTANLAGDIDEGGTWRPSAAGKALNLSETSIRQMQRAAAIRQAFFKPGDVRPNVRFVLEPVNLPANATAVTLTIDGTPAAFDPSARKSVELHWPGGVGGVTLGFQVGRGAPVTHSWNGDWAFAKMLAEAKITGATSEGLIFETGVETYRATFRMRFLNTTNPFTLPDLRTFACPLEF